MSPSAVMKQVSALSGRKRKHGYVLQFDGERTKAMYELGDSLMERNVMKELENYKIKELKEEMEQEVKAIVQQYMERMTEDRLTTNYTN